MKEARKTARGGRDNAFGFPIRREESPRPIREAAGAEKVV